MRQPTIQRTFHRLQALCAAALLVSAGAASAATPAATPDTATANGKQAIEARYQRERAKCLDGTSNQARETCLREAGAAREQAMKEGALTTGDATTLRRNALERCKTLPANEQAACRERIDGAGVTSGSVGSGGILRELTQVEPAPASAPKADVKAAEPLPTK